MTEKTKIVGEAERELGAYVYLYIDPRNGKPFYVGKGRGWRAFAHLDMSDAKKAAVINDIRKSGKEVRIEILRYGLSDADALMVEAAAIDLIGKENLVNRMSGHARGCGRISNRELRSVLDGHSAKPVTVRHAALLLTVNRLYRGDMTRADGTTTEELYEITRGAWKVGGRRENAECAIAVFHGVAREVYRIDGWRPAGGGRWEFSGTVAKDIRGEYVGKFVGKNKRGHISPVRGVNLNAPKTATVRHKALLLTVSKLYRDDMTRPDGTTTYSLYEAARRAWRIGAQRENAEYAIAVYNGIAREVYRIDGWRSVGGNRWEFSGTVAKDIRGEYVGKFVGKNKRGHASPFRGVNLKDAGKTKEGGSKMQKKEKPAAKPAAETVAVRHKAVLFIINNTYRAGMSAGELYEITRKAWRLDAKRARKAEYAMAVRHGVVREVYRIDSDSWRPAERKDRWEFSGTVAEDIRGEYVDKSVGKNKRGHTNPVRYANI